MMKELSMHIMDIVQNSVVAGATHILVVIDENPEQNVLSFEIDDNGSGMSKEIIERVKNPFTTSRTTRKVGLGIPMLTQTCEMCGGRLDIESEQGVGTKLYAKMEYNNIDRPPLGDIKETMLILITTTDSADFTYTHRVNGKQFTIDTKEIKDALGNEVSLRNPEVYSWISENLEESLLEIRQ